jgi:DNA-binding MltR family transcriptional regulator
VEKSESIFPPENLREQLVELSKPFLDALGKESDRAIGIIAACLLDNLLEKLIRTAYIKDPQVKFLFKDDHILQSFFSKINTAYFSGLIPKLVYHDLKLICEIRNRFAHTITENLTLNDSSIAQRIGSCALRPKTLDDVFAPKIKFIIVVQQIVSLLVFWEKILSKARLPNLVEMFKLNDLPFEEIALTKQEIIDVIRREKAKIEGKE